jgi:hypothetical protein
LPQRHSRSVPALLRGVNQAFRDVETATSDEPIRRAGIIFH